VQHTVAFSPLFVTAPSWRVEASMTSSDLEFEQFFLDNYDSVCTVLVLTTGDRERATDAAQEAFIKAYARWSKIRTYDSPAAWVRRVAINASRDSKRSEVRRRRREQATTNGDESVHTDLYGSESTAHSLLDELPRRQREAAMLYYVDDRSVTEIAQILKLNEGTVKYHLSQARERLRDVMQHGGAPR
jgi:RNA polymerase sigma-70 factor, ECF subfamily